MADRPANDQVYRLLSTAVDQAFYRGVHHDRIEGGEDPVWRYMESGWREGCDPAPWFSTAGYLERHPDVAAAGLNPLQHYLQNGRAEGREIVRSRHAERWFAEIRPALASAPSCFDPAPRRKAPLKAAALAPSAASPADRQAIAPEFDAEFYLALYGDVAKAGIDPLEHFLVFGWQEGRDPNARFSVNSYLSLHPDVAAAGVNPFVHYVRTGRTEGRATREQLGFRHDVIAALIPVEDRLSACDRALAAVRPDDPTRLTTAFAQAGGRLADLHVTFSHDDYTANLGGVQLCLQREAAGVRAQGRAHLHLYPAAARPMLLERRQGALWGVLLDDAPLGVFPARQVVAALGETLAGAKGRGGFAIHSLLGHNVEDVIELLTAAGLKSGCYWLHDFTSVCAGVHLLRDDVADCGAPPAESPACRICIYGPWRGLHVDAHRRLFDALSLTVIAPSQAALDTWRLGPAYPVADARVHPLATMAPRPPVAPPVQEGPFLFGYLGLPVAHKGWPIFRELALTFAEDPRYAFVHLGKAPVPGVPAAFREVVVRSDDPRAMQSAIEAAGLDAVMLWSICRETFSFTAHESAAAGAAIVTGPDSGNIAAFVTQGGHGKVLPDEAALFAAFQSGAILDLARARRRPVLYDLSFSALSVDLEGEPA